MNTLKKALKRIIFILAMVLLTLNLTGCQKFMAKFLPILQTVGQIVSDIGGIVGGEEGQGMQIAGRVLTGVAQIGTQLNRGAAGGAGNATGTGGAGNGQNGGGL